MASFPGEVGRVQVVSSEFRVLSSGFKVQGSGFRVPGSRVQGFKVQGFRVFRGATDLFLSVCSVLSVANLVFFAPFAVIQVPGSGFKVQGSKPPSSGFESRISSYCAVAGIGDCPYLDFAAMERVAAVVASTDRRDPGDVAAHRKVVSA